MSTRDHRIRIAVAHLKGEARTEAIDYLLRHPEKMKVFGNLRKVLPRKLPQLKRRGGMYMNVSIHLTDEEYVILRSRAEGMGMSMNQYIKWTIGLTS